jgi:hypothetical protein
MAEVRNVTCPHCEKSIGKVTLQGDWMEAGKRLLTKHLDKSPKCKEKAE